MTGSNGKVNYMPQLDALRAFAVVLVLLHHWLPEKSVVNYFPTGPMGVTLFFVLSGFLISRILLINRENIQKGLQSHGEVIRTFYIRRSLRIFPIYFVVIFLCLAFNIENIEDHFGWFATYTSNILHFTTEQWMGPLSHLWTLAVEEQYYLIVPFIIIFIPEKFLLKTIWVIILLGPITRLLIYYLNPGSDHPEILMSVLTLSALDCFGLGTLLAYIRVKGDQKTNERFDFYLWNLFILAFIGFAFLVSLFDTVWTSLWLRSLFSIVSLFVIDMAAKGIKGKMKIIMENPIILYLGKISYGIYLFHMFVPFVWQEVQNNYPDNFLTNYLSGNKPFVLFIFYFGITLAVSALSWVFIEKPVNDLKKLFEYGKIIPINKARLLRRGTIVATCVVIVAFTIPATQEQSNSANSNSEKPKIFKAKATGFFVPDFNKAIKDTSYNISAEIPFDYDIISLYLAWGEEESFDIPVNMIQRLEKEGKKVFITWEPWTATFPSMKLDNKDVHSAISQGKFDSFLQKQANILKEVTGPVYIRWGHNADRIDVPWSAITQKEIGYYKKAHSYLIHFLRKELGDKIKWVWPAPSPSRIADYLPEKLEMDYIGCPGINYGENIQDKNWREFKGLYEKYETELEELKVFGKVPVFITEIGVAKSSIDEKKWLMNAVDYLQEKKEIKHSVFFVFNKASLKPEWFIKEPVSAYE